MKLFNLNLGLGLATFVAEDVMQVLCLIRKHNDLKYIYQGVSSKDILEDIKEVPGYNVSGEPGVIAFYRE